jgi:type IX secretion system substrate protein
MKKLLTRGMHLIALTILIGIMGINSTKAQDYAIKCDAQFDPAGYFHVMWHMEGDLDKVESYKVFLAEGFIKDIDGNMDKFEEIYSATAEELEEEFGIVGFYEVTIDYPYEKAFLEATLIVQATLDNGDEVNSYPSYIDYYKVDPNERLMFTSIPDQLILFKGEVFEYTAKAEYPLDNEKAVKYELQIAPESMTIDETTGYVKWAPIDEGWYEVAILASLVENPKINAVQYFQIIANRCEEPTILSGTIKDEDGNLVTSGQVSVLGGRIKIDVDGGMKVDFSYVVTQSVNDGHYNFGVDGGKYLLMYNNEFIGEVWYEDGATMSDAKIIEVECDVEKVVNMVVPVIDFELYTVGGIVIDQDNNPVPNAMVTFMAVEGEFELHQYKAFTAITNENGEYSIELPDFAKYKAFMFPMDGKDFIGFEMPLYYNQTYDPKKAELIELTADRDDINFEIGTTEDFNYYKISGVVTDADDNPMAGVLVMVTGTNDNPDFFCNKIDFSVMTGENGFYEVEAPDIFDYIVAAHNHLDYYGSLYYNQTYNYTEAEVLKLTADRDDINFQFKEYEDVTGKIQGKVVDGEGNNLPIAMLEAIMVETADEDNGYFGYAMHAYAEGGDFSFSHLIPGKYILFAFGYDESKIYEPGFYVQNEVVTLDLEKATKIEITENMIASGIEIQVEEMKGIVEDVGNNNGKVNGSVINAKSSANISQAKIYLQDDQGKIVDFESTSNSGVFNMNIPSNGDFTLKAIKVGYEDYSRDLQITENGNLNLGTIALKPTTVLSVVDLLKSNGAFAFPNPARNEFKIAFESNGGLINARLLDIRGNVLDYFVINGTSGVTTYNYQNENLTSGTYYIELNENKAMTVIPIVIAR